MQRVNVCFSPFATNLYERLAWALDLFFVFIPETFIRMELYGDNSSSWGGSDAG